jgi:hypothetical protein
MQHTNRVKKSVRKIEQNSSWIFWFFNSKFLKSIYVYSKVIMHSILYGSVYLLLLYICTLYDYNAFFSVYIYISIYLLLYICVLYVYNAFFSLYIYASDLLLYIHILYGYNVFFLSVLVHFTYFSIFVYSMDIMHSFLCMFVHLI